MLSVRKVLTRTTVTVLPDILVMAEYAKVTSKPDDKLYR